MHIDSIRFNKSKYKTWVRAFCRWLCAENMLIKIKQNAISEQNFNCFSAFIQKRKNLKNCRIIKINIWVHFLLYWIKSILSISKLIWYINWAHFSTLLGSIQEKPSLRGHHVWPWSLFRIHNHVYLNRFYYTDRHSSVHFVAAQLSMNKDAPVLIRR